MNDDNKVRETIEESSDREIKEMELGKSSKSKKKAEVAELKKKIKELEDQLSRAVADYRNQQMRFEDEKREFVKYANRDLLLRLIPAFDTLFLAEKFVTDEGIKLTIRHLRDSLKEVGVERVRSEGEMFDAQTMEAVATDAGGENKVLEELRPGYTLNGKLIRPAQVKVGKVS